MSDIATLNNMIHDNAKITLLDHYDKAYVLLQESDTPDSSVQIKGLPQDAVIIKIDDAFKNDQFFSGKNGECKRADYAIIAKAGDKKRILYIEMKKTKDQRNSIVKQLKGAKCVMDYCCNIASVFYGKSGFLSGYEPRFISFGHTSSIRKRRTRIKRSESIHSTPENLMKIDWPANVQFSHLAG
ncbi:hypothetical protein QUF70_01885 [Desulfobacterales bacterium HSG17]|nr:hypothetical protein [Desulfobacterales bacterium HSG17]